MNEKIILEFLYKKENKFREKAMKKIAKGKIILDLGGAKPFQKSMKKYEPLFQNCVYETLDIVPDFNPTIVGDICNIPKDDSSVDGIICNGVLEHVYNPFKAVEEMERILKKGGKAWVSVPFLAPFHANENYKDYWRFTYQGIEKLFKSKFSRVEIVEYKKLSQTILNLMPIPHFLRNFFLPLAYLVDLTHKNKSQVNIYFVYLEK